MEHQFNPKPSEISCLNRVSHHSTTNIISHLEPNLKKFNYFDLHAHQLIDPLDILPAPAH